MNNNTPYLQTFIFIHFSVSTQYVYIKGTGAKLWNYLMYIYLRVGARKNKLAFLEEKSFKALT